MLLLRERYPGPDKLCCRAYPVQGGPRIAVRANMFKKRQILPADGSELLRAEVEEGAGDLIILMKC